jgi:predicted DNA binding protein
MRNRLTLRCLTFDLFHQDCWTTHLNDIGNTVEAVPIFRKPFHPRLGSETILAVSGERDALQKTHSSITRTQNVQVTKYFCSSLARRRAEIWNVNIIMKNSVIRLFDRYGISYYDATYSGGCERWLLAFDSRVEGSIPDLLQDLTGKGILSNVRNVDPDELIFHRTRSMEQLLSGRSGMDLVRLLLDCGFYDFPRKMSLTEIASAMGINKSTLSEKIRKAERNVILAAAGRSDGFPDEGSGHN